MVDVADRNSHARLADTYLRRVRVFKPIRTTLIQLTMSPQEIIAVLQV